MFNLTALVGATQYSYVIFGVSGSLGFRRVLCTGLTTTAHYIDIAGSAISIVGADRKITIHSAVSGSAATIVNFWATGYRKVG